MIDAIEKINKGKNRIASLEIETYYVPVIDGKEYSHVAETRDVALLIALGLKYDGANTQFPKLACRMLNIDSLWSK